ncbi:MAG: hypothetical protein Q9172_005267 [Xanthocarpia lactea]
MEPSDKLLMLGQQEYMRKNYHAALDHLDSLIVLHKQRDINALDCRAATYEKLGDLNAALKDGRRMIVGYPTECAGYLRTGKVLQLLDKDTVALGIYKYGLRRVSPDASRYQLLRELYETLNRRCGPRKAKDPLTVLPTEVAQLIISYLDFTHIISLTRVSTTWRNYLKSTPSLWESLDFSKAKTNVSKTAIQRYVRFSQGRVTKIVLSRFVTQQPTNLQYLASLCKGLEHIEIHSGYCLTPLVEAASVAQNLRCLLLYSLWETTLDCISQILGNCRNLVRAEFHAVTSCAANPQWQGEMPQLRTLVLNMVEDTVEPRMINASLTHSLLSLIPNIRELTLRRWRSTSTIPTANILALTHLEKLVLTNFAGEIRPEALPSLRVLELDHCPSAMANLSTPGPMADLSVESLVELSLMNDTALTIDSFLRLLELKPMILRKLRLPRCFQIAEAEITRLVDMGIMDQVVELDLTGLHVTDTLIKSLVVRAHQLESTSLVRTDITGVGVKALVTKPGCKLRYLNISDCFQISADAVAFARNVEGLTVKCNRYENRGKKKIRYE